MYFRFANIEYLFLLLLIPLVWTIYLITRTRKKKELSEFVHQSLLGELIPDISVFRARFKFILFSLAIAFMVVALARPQFGKKLQEIKREGVEIIIALDVSNSMLADDIKPNRLERSKQAISKLVGRLDDDRIGLIVFAGEAYTQLPITTDYVSAKMFLSSITTDIVPIQGTAIGSAIELGSKSFSPNTEASKVLVIITDGENHEGDAVEQAQAASNNGISVYTIGMGSSAGSPIPVSNRAGEFLKDKEGNVVISKVNEEMLNKIAIAGGGRYIPANNTEIGLNVLLNEVNKLNKAEFESRVYSEYDDKFHWAVWTVLILLCIEIFVLDRKNKFLSRIKFFKE